MPLDATVPQQFGFFDLPSARFNQMVQEWGWPRFRADQVRDWVYGKLVVDPQQMSNLSRRDRQRLAESVCFASATVAGRQTSSDGTEKLLLSWATPDANAETVMIPDGDRRTACVSSQVGCPVGCKFCASGIGGMKGNLSAGQIVEQVWQLNRLLAAQAESRLNPEPRTLNPPRITNIVFMGMGEPLANYANVLQSIRILHDPKHFNIGARKITISTVGVPPKMRQLAHEDLPLNLAISLHAPNEPLRRELIPWAEHFKLEDILDAAAYYFEQTGREVTLEYILLAGVNDRPQHARQLVSICRTLRCNVNLIRYNEVESLPFKRPLAQDVVKFQSILRDAGVNAHVRKSRGRDIDAACGQLRRKQQQRREQFAQSDSQPARLSPLTPPLSPPDRARQGFTAVELLVVLGIVIILLSIFIPYLLKIRETSNRNACRNNLLQIRAALQAYADDNGKNFPRVRYDEQQNPNGYVAFSGPDDPDPFAPDSVVQPNDVTASLWLLVRGGYLPDLGVFVCPSSDDRSDRLTDASGRPVEPTRRSNFRGPSNLSYSYASPFSSAQDYRLNSDWINADFALIADKNPGTHRLRSGTTLPSFGVRPRELAAANSRNHRGAGQNVVYGHTSIEWRTTPYCGVEQDNIYTALERRPLEPGEKPPAYGTGYLGQHVAPVWYGDSYLVPVEGDVAPPPHTAPATQPATAPSTPTEEPAPAPAATAPAEAAPPTTAATTAPATTSTQPATAP